MKNGVDVARVRLSDQPCSCSWQLCVYLRERGCLVYNTRFIVPYHIADGVSWCTRVLMPGLSYHISDGLSAVFFAVESCVFMGGQPFELPHFELPHFAPVSYLGPVKLA